jgi:predicted RNA binding protein YcfA (HicA-like mRNA interferase family)
MSQLEKLKEDFRNCRGEYSYGELLRLLKTLGFVQMKAGKTGGSRRKFEHPETGKRIFLDEPHGSAMGPGMVKRLREDLIRSGLL